MHHAYTTLDEQILKIQQRNIRVDRSGTTAVTVLVDHTDIVTGNVGDTRAILCRSDLPIELSVDHKPTDLIERRRIECAGGRVTIPVLPAAYLQRNANSPALKALQAQAVGGYAELGDKGLAVSRAFGDISFKLNKSLPHDQQVVISVPTVKYLQRDQTRDQFIVLCTDGLTNIADNQDIVSFVRERLVAAFTTESYNTLQDRMNAMSGAYINSRDLSVTASPHRNDVQIIEDIANELTQYALDLESNDNITVVIAVFATYIQQLKRAGIERALQAAEQQQAEYDQQAAQRKHSTSNAITPNAVRRPPADHLNIDTVTAKPDMFTVTAVVNDADLSAGNVHPSQLGSEEVQTLNRLQRTIYTRAALSHNKSTGSPLPVDLFTAQTSNTDSNIRLSADQLQQYTDDSVCSSTPVKLRTIQ